MASRIDWKRRSMTLKKNKSRESVVDVDVSPVDLEADAESSGATIAFKAGTSIANSHSSVSSGATADESSEDCVGTRDLANLANLNTSNITAELRLRYENRLIYTGIGDILVAINPFQQLDNLYGERVSKRYFHNVGVSNIPHVFRVAQVAYKTLLQTHKGQCCVISGESGAGKTETAKLIVEQLLAMCKGTGTLEQRIMQVNPLLEAFGNARTVINDNSSRFGKYLDVKFGYYGEVLGAQMSEYLLEKSRVVRQADGERNFHVFYYMFHGLDSEVRTRLELADITSYHYLRGGASGVTRDGVIDLDAGAMTDEFNNLVLSMSDVGFAKEDRDNAFLLLATLLHVGNIEFEEGEDSFALISSLSPLDTVGRLLGVEEESLRFMLVSTTTILRGESVQTNYDVGKACDNRDALAKAMYGRLFGWIVGRANTLLSPSGAQYDDAKGREGGVTDVGILDIFGFENFETNSFEQFCINVANEQLQFYFNQHIFAWEQQSYMQEGLDASAVKFKDNQGLLNMVLQKPLGIFALLDEECRFPRATPASWIEKVCNANDTCRWECFRRVEKTRRVEPTSVRGRRISSETKEESPLFEISHFAGKVTYNSMTFLDKNRDSLSATVLSTVKKSQNGLIKKLFSTKPGRTGTFAAHANERKVTVSKSNPSKQSVSAHFKNSLLDLMDKMMRSSPYFVRCIKPNKNKIPNNWNEEMIEQQLLYTGVLETIKIRRDGFAIRMKFEEFIERYHSVGLKCYEIPDLDPDSETAASPEVLRTACKMIVTAANLRGVQLGKSMIFLKYYHGNTLLKILENLHAAATVLNTVARGFLARRILLNKREAHARAIAEAAARVQREAEERAAAEKVRLEILAAEEAAAAAAAAAVEAERLAAEEEARAKLETIKRARQSEAEQQAKRRAAEIAAAEAAAAAEVARLQMENAKAEREEMLKHQAELLTVEKEAEAAALAQAEREKEEYKLKTQEQFEIDQAAARAKKLSESMVPDQLSTGIQDTVCYDDDDDDDDDENNFLQYMSGMPGTGNDDDNDVNLTTSEQRQKLLDLQAQRKAEERARKHALKQEHAREVEEARLKRILELDAIAEQQRKEKEAREKQFLIDEAESKARLADMDFGAFSFSWGTQASPSQATQTAAPASEVVTASAPVSELVHEPSVIVENGDLRNSKAAPVMLKKIPPPVAPKVRSSVGKKPVKIPTTSSAPTKAFGSAEVVAPVISLANTLSIRSKRKKQPPPNLPNATVDRISDEMSPSGALASCETKSAGTLSAHAKKQKSPPPLLTEKATTEATESAGLSSSSASPAPLNKLKSTSSSAQTVASVRVVGEKKPPRRKLVRGGNAIVTPVLPVYEQAVKAIEDLDIFLDAEYPSSPMRKPRPSEAQLNALGDLFLIGERSSIGDPANDNFRATEDKNNPATPPAATPVSPEAKARFIKGATLTTDGLAAELDSRLRLGSTSSQVSVKGYKLSAHDVMSMGEAERIAILSRVKDGAMSVDEALHEFIEHKRRQNCLVM